MKTRWNTGWDFFRILIECLFDSDQLDDAVKTWMIDNPRKTAELSANAVRQYYNQEVLKNQRSWNPPFRSR